MDHFKRFALYAMAEGALHEEASNWLGWDSRLGQAVDHPQVSGLPLSVQALTDTPRKYGFHGTIKPPFRLADGKTPDMLQAACEALLPTVKRARVERMVVRPLGGFVAFVPETPSDSLNSLANQVVKLFDDYRAPLNEQELTKRRKHTLTPTQEANLSAWGYPYVFDEFRFHMTLSCWLGEAKADTVAGRLQAHFEPVTPQPFEINTVSLLGEDSDGMFHVIQTYALAG